MHAKAYGLPKKDLQYKDLGDMNSYGYYSHWSDTVVLSDHVDAKTGTPILDDAAEAFDTVVHENTHRYQNDLVRRLNDGDISDTSEIYDQARLMRANEEYYAKSDADYAAYRSQPSEGHAWNVGSVAK